MDGPFAPSMPNQEAATTTARAVSPDDVLLQVDHLTTAFDAAAGTVRAVDDASFAVYRGETVALVGESGCGKTVTALSIMRLVPPPGRIVSGRILLEGQDLAALSEREMQAVRGARISLVFQEPMSALNPVFSIGDQVAEAILVHRVAPRRESWARAVDLLESVRIPDPAHTARAYPHQLSGGMRQRVLIAMALACRPSLIIADEPTTALDVTIQAEILDLLRDMKAKHGLSLLLITHDLGIVAETADRVLVMYAGRIVEESPVRTLFAAAAHPYTKGLLASVAARTDGRRLPAIEGAVPDLAALPPGCAFGPRCKSIFDRCRVEAPARVALDDTHAVRCHLFDGPEGPPYCSGADVQGRGRSEARPAGSGTNLQVRGTASGDSGLDRQ